MRGKGKIVRTVPELPKMIKRRYLSVLISVHNVFTKPRPKAWVVSFLSLNWRLGFLGKGKKVEISDREFERFRQIDERLFTTFSEKRYLNHLLQKSGLSLAELRDVIILIREIETQAQKLLGDEIGVKVITGDEIGVKVITFIAREEPQHKKLFSVIKAGVIAGVRPRRVHSQLIINLLGPQWNVVDKSHHPEVYAMIIAQSLGRVALAYPDVCDKLSLNPAKLAEEMVQKYKDVFDARELWINVFKLLATKIGQLIIGEKTYNTGARWILDYDLPQKPSETAKEIWREEVTEKIHRAKRKKLPMLAGWQAEALITQNKSVADRIEEYIKEICKKPLLESYRAAVTDYMSVTGKVTTGLVYSKLKVNGRP